MWKTLRPAKETRIGSDVRMPSTSLASSEILTEDHFARMLYLERKRTERSGHSFVLMLLEARKLLRRGPDDEALGQIILALSRSTRETDMRGWYLAGSVMGVIFTEIGEADGRNVALALLNKVTQALCGTLGIEQICDISLSFHVFPDDWENGGPDDPIDSRLYPDLLRDMEARRGPRLVKRTLDIVGSLCALVVFSPLFVVIASVIKFTSKGPVFFRQTRVGQYGRKFTFLKFRSMKAASDQTVHKDYVKQLIAGQASGTAHNGSNVLYKLTNDSRITRAGRFLRRTSLDELPQFFNVLTGEMSLVGPRPPIPYELQCYQPWHKRRLLSVKPGITGLWQVGGRNKLRFEEMVRMDLQYAHSWTVWKDIKILLKTPTAVISLDGAV